MSERTHPPNRPSRWVAAFALALLVACRPPDPRHDAVRLAASAGLEGWLADGPAAGATETAAAGEELRRRVAGAAGARTADQQAVGGLLALHFGQPDRAVSMLAAASERSESWRDANDLAVARLERLRRGGPATDLVAALGAASRARRQAPGHPEAAFNLALVLSKFGLRQVAGQEWERLRRSPDRDLSALAARWEERSRAGDGGGWQALRERLEASSPSDDDLMAAAVERYPLLVHSYVRLELIESWGEAAAGGRRRQADEVLRLGAALGSAIAAATGDRSVERLYAFLAGRCADERCVRSHLDYAGGGRAFLSGSYARAERDLARGARGLHEAGSPLAPWADYYLAYASFHRGISASTRTLDRLLGEGLAERDPVLAGRLHWRLAVAVGSARQPALAAQHVETGSRLMCGAVGAPGCAFEHTLLSEIDDLSGDLRGGWEHRLRALRGVSRYGTLRQLHSTLTVTVQALVRQGYGEVVEPFIEELELNARRTGNPEFVTEALRERGRYEASRGDLTEAVRRFAAARGAADALQPSHRQRQLLCTIDLAEGAANVDTDPLRAVTLLDRAAAAPGCAGNAFFRLFIHTHRAAAYGRLGELGRSSDDLAAALAAFESQRRATAGEARVLTLVEAQPIYDDLVRILVRSGRAADALSVAERSRNRFLLEARLRSAGSAGETLSGGEIVERLPRDTLLVELAQLDDALIVWVAGRGELRAVEVGLGADEARRLVANLVGEVRAGVGEAELRPQTTALYRRLLSPLAVDLTAYARLLVVPDRAFVRLPFAALTDPRDGRPLIDRVEVVTAPSASMVLTPVEAAPPTRPPLVVAGPDLAATEAATLPRLSGVFDEARRVTGHFPQAIVLSRSAATREAFLEHAPGAGFIHFAGHALADAEAPFRSRLPLAAAGDGPTALEVGELLTRRLDTPLVVLSACRTLTGFRVDREEMLGLAGGFYVAGAAAVVATLWEAEDGAGSELMDAFYDSYAAGSSPASAFRDAVARRRRADPEGRRPLGRWATYVVLQGLNQKPQTIESKESGHGRA